MKVNEARNYLFRREDSFIGYVYSEMTSIRISNQIGTKKLFYRFIHANVLGNVAVFLVCG
ncbi:hypothetical protein GCM10027085_27210 [Spirosoma aerophilum]